MCHQFTTLSIAALLDALVDAVDTARASTAPAAWQNAISTAYDFLLQQDSISYDLNAHALRVESATRAGRVYVANGDCQCEAFTKGAGVCWHRAAARLVHRALELQALAAELHAEAAEAGETWYTAEIARVGAKWRYPELTGVAAEWDAAAEQRRALVSRITAARAAVLAA